MNFAFGKIQYSPRKDIPCTCSQWSRIGFYLLRWIKVLDILGYELIHFGNINLEKKKNRMPQFSGINF
jgi:hypothetical protein